MHIAHRYYDEGRPSIIFYDAVESLYRPVEQELAFYRSQLSACSATTVLELGCGTGRITWPLAEMGYHILAVDIAPAALKRARAKATHFSLEAASRIEWRQADICQAAFDRDFSGILAPYRVFDHLASEAQQRALLAGVRQHLAPGGRFVFDTTLPSAERLQGGISLVSQAPLVLKIPHLGMILERAIAHSVCDRELQILTTDFLYRMRFASGELHEHIDQLSVRWMTPEQMRSMLNEEGFCVESECADFAETIPKQGDEDRIWVARVRV